MTQIKAQIKKRTPYIRQEKAYVKPLIVESDVLEQAEQRARFSRIHFLRGKVRIAGHFIHVEYLWLAVAEWLLSAVIFSVVDYLFVNVTASVSFIVPTIECVIFSSLVVISLAAMGLYETRQRNTLFDIFLHILIALTLCAVFMFVLKSILELVHWPYQIIVLGVAVLASLLTGVRVFFEKHVDGRLLRRNILVLGTGKRASKIEKLRRKSDKRGFNLVGFQASKSCQHCYVNPDKLLSINSLCEYALNNKIDEIVVALDNRRHGWPVKELLDCRMSGIDITEDLDFFERESLLIQLDLMQNGWIIRSKGFANNYTSYLVKRCVDILGSVLLGVILLPVILIASIFIKIECGWRSSVFYSQQRVGRAGKIFTIHKLRSMCENAEKDGRAQWASQGDHRITKVGAVIRKYRIDEIPQIWNVLVGAMSLVGPRPERKEFVDSLSEMNEYYPERHRLAPGLTGWAQLCYPYGASDKDAIEKLKYDLYYIKNHSLFLDLYILIQTVEVVLFQKGAR